MPNETYERKGIIKSIMRQYLFFGEKNLVITLVDPVTSNKRYILPVDQAKPEVNQLKRGDSLELRCITGNAGTEILKVYMPGEDGEKSKLIYPVHNKPLEWR